jgi:hypothetical protein
MALKKSELYSFVRWAVSILQQLAAESIANLAFCYHLCEIWKYVRR